MANAIGFFLFMRTEVLFSVFFWGCAYSLLKDLGEILRIFEAKLFRNRGNAFFCTEQALCLLYFHPLIILHYGIARGFFKNRIKIGFAVKQAFGNIR